MDLLAAYGWTSYCAQQTPTQDPDGSIPARIVSEQRGLYQALTAQGELTVELSGRLRHEALSPQELPAVGDWVALRLAPDNQFGLILQVMPRKSRISRGAPGRTAQEQILAANVDTAFVVTTADKDFNPRRLERYLAVIWDGAARPVILINKIDLCADSAGLLAQAGLAFPGVDIHPISALQGQGLGPLSAYLKPERTCVMLGSSGVGKSTLLNRIIGKDVARLGAVRQADQRGRHTTTSRQMFILPSGGLLIDTPGLRELRLGKADDGLRRAFADIGSLSQRCRFRDCRHIDEPGCAVLAALQNGTLARSHYDNYLKLQKEQDYQRRREDPALEAQNKKRWKSIHKTMRSFDKLTRGEE
ncbi:MAG: ribosome small subunit-dependent GTPase A [Elusimicrobia bacterium]|nr:ribosome small subunit-dependent GTPase A [Elusimicrobiota bacterium]